MIASGLRVLIIGGYGTFGSRLARLLKDDPRFHLIIGGRSLENAHAFAAALGDRAEGAWFDRDRELISQLKALMPSVIVDASGPFQAMGEDRYRVPEAAMALGISYLDLADSRAFVAGIGGLDAAARECGVFVLSGLSSFPALSFAAAEVLAAEFSEVTGVSTGIAPSPRAGIGLNVIKAIASYAGKPVPMTRDGRAQDGVGLVDFRRMVIAPPGVVPLRSRDFLLADAPDLALLGQRFPEIKTAFTGAGTEPRWLQSLLRLAALMVRFRLLPSLSPFATLIHAMSRRLGFGEHRGGMFVSVEGKGLAGEHHRADWHLIAEGDDGPFIPATGAAALLRALADGRRPASGARPAIGEVPLSAFEAAFRSLAIRTGIRRQSPANGERPLYQRVLGDAWQALPAAVAQMHSVSRGEYRVSGRARVERGKGLLASLVAAVIGFPKAAEDIPVSVTFTVENGRETWVRDFGGRRFLSRQLEGSGRHAHLLAEEFGPIRVFIALVPGGGRMRLVIRGWQVFGLPLPRFLAPDGDTFEEERDGRFHFHVEIGGPLTGLIVRYTGWLTPD